MDNITKRQWDNSNDDVEHGLHPRKQVEQQVELNEYVVGYLFPSWEELSTCTVVFTPFHEMLCHVKKWMTVWA